MSSNWRQKLNTGSSTEAELVGIDDALRHIMWGLYFIQAQGYEVTKNILMQDNKPTILLAKNGRFSSSKRTKHTKNRYFMIKDKIGKGEIIIQYCPTGDIWADINTKALQGALFYKMRARLMGISENYNNKVEQQSAQPGLLPPQECAAPTMLTKDALVLTKAGTLTKALAITTMASSQAPKMTQFVVAALLIRAVT